MTSKGYKVIIVLLTILLLSQISYQACAQVTANFTANITSGCKPLVTQFTDQSTGAITSWRWNFGNGNTSTQQNPGAIYPTPGCFSVRLIVSDGITSDTMVKPCYMTVFQDPTAFLTADINAGCLPLTVNFSDSSVIGSSGLKTWVWDFGDGNVSTLQNPSHTYLNEDIYSVTLLVVDSNNCQNNVIKPNFIQASDYPKPGFSADPVSSCFAPLDVRFYDSTVSMFPLSYLWNFGDGDTSTAESPLHTYASLGNYNVKLNAETSVGCKDSLTKTNFINIQSIVVDFSSNTQQACVGDSVQFTDLTLPIPDSWTWDFGDGVTSNLQNPKHAYSSAGTYNVSLTASNSGACSGLEVKTGFITVNQNPQAEFTADITQSCLIPHNVNFTDSSQNAVAWEWIFGDGNTSNQQNPSHIYTAAGDYTVSLIVTSPDGCYDTISKTDFVRLAPPDIEFDATPRYGCTPRTVQFSDSTVSSDPIISWLWNFGDGDTSTLQNPSHDYITTGSFHVSLTVQAASGCGGTFIDSNFAGAGIRPVTDFIADPLIACIYTPVNFYNNTNNSNQWHWDFGDGSTSDEFEPTHTYADTGLFTITLISRDNGCADTLEKVDYIYVSPPDAIFSVTQNCTNPLQVAFTDNSLGPDTWAWDFGDGNSSTAKHPTHTYASTGGYTITLTVTNSATGCFDVASVSITVADPAADFFASSLVGCKPLTVNFTNISTNAVSYSWLSGGFTSTAGNPAFTYTTAGTYSVRLVVTDINGCVDTMLKPNYITVLGSVANFGGTPVNGCSPLEVTFTDSSTSYLSAITDWKWYFGDGDSSTLQNPVHIYTTTGTYTVTLVVTDGNGCSHSMIRTNYIKPTFPTPEFTADTVSCTAYTVQFVNNSVGTGMTFTWDFGDSVTSIGTNPQHLYPTEGLYTVSLTATDANGCDSTLTKINYINVINPVADFGADNTFSPCPPLLVNFKDSSLGNISTWNWRFGDNTSSTVKNPSHIYLAPGDFDVSLIITNNLGCKDTATKVDLVVLLGPNGTFDFNPKQECLDNDIFFQANTTNTVSRIWDFGDGTVIGGLDTITHTYTTSGIYHPSIILNDGLGCIFFVQSLDSAIVGNIIADFEATDYVPCPNQAIQFADSSFAFPAITSRLWDFGDSTTSNALSPSHLYTTSGYFDVTLIVSNGLCTDTLIRPNFIYVDLGPQADFAAPSKGCTPVAIQFQDYTLSDSALVSWSWDFGDGSTDTVQNPAHTYLATGNFNIELIVVSNNNCTDTITQPIDVYGLPVADAGPDTSICHTTPVQLNGYGGVQFSWLPAIGLDDDSIAQPIATPDSSTTYVLTVTDSNTCQDTDTMTLTIHTLPVADAIEDQEICVGNSVELWATGGVTYDWLPAAGLDCSTCSNPIAQPDTTTLYTITVSSAFKCEDHDTVMVTVHERPIGITSADTGVCIGKDVQLISQGGVTHFWFPTNSLDCANCANPIATPDTTTTYSLLLYNQYNCETYDSVTVQVYPLPTIQIDADTMLCSGQSSQISSRGGIAYLWTPDTALSCNSCPNPLATPDTTITYDLEVTSVFGCINHDTLTIEVFPLAFVQTIEDVQICNGDQIQLTTIYEDVDTFNWSPVTGLVNPANGSPTASPTQTTQYIVNTFNSADCPSSDTVLVTVIDKVDAVVSGDISVCIGQSVQLEALIIQQGAMGSNVIWFPVNGISNPSNFTQTIAPINSITYYLVAYSGSCIPDTEAVHITVNALPVVDAGPVQYVIDDYETTLTPTSTSNITAYYWLPEEQMNCPDCEKPVAQVGNEDQVFHVIVTDENGCVSSDSVLIKVIGRCGEDIFVPNTFTPNHDERNDQLFVRGKSIGQLDYFRVFDRWGNLMFETKEQGEGWDGLYHGKKLNPSVFVYGIKGLCKDGKPFKKEGNVTLIR